MSGSAVIEEEWLMGGGVLRGWGGTCEVVCEVVWRECESGRKLL